MMRMDGMTLSFPSFAGSPHSGPLRALHGGSCFTTRKLTKALEVEVKGCPGGHIASCLGLSWCCTIGPLQSHLFLHTSCCFSF